MLVALGMSAVGRTPVWRGHAPSKSHYSCHASPAAGCCSGMLQRCNARMRCLQALRWPNVSAPALRTQRLLVAASGAHGGLAGQTIVRRRQFIRAQPEAGSAPVNATLANAGVHQQQGGAAGSAAHAAQGARMRSLLWLEASKPGAQAVSARAYGRRRLRQQPIAASGSSSSDGTDIQAGRRLEDMSILERPSAASGQTRGSSNALSGSERSASSQSAADVTAHIRLLRDVSGGNSSSAAATAGQSATNYQISLSGSVTMGGEGDSYYECVILLHLHCRPQAPASLGSDPCVFHKYTMLPGASKAHYV